MISTLRDLETNQHLLSALREHGYTGRVAVAAGSERTAAQLEAAGADLTIRPLHVAAGPLLAAMHTHDAPGPLPDAELD